MAAVRDQIIVSSSVLLESQLFKGSEVHKTISSEIGK